MLRTVGAIKGYRLKAADGFIGRVREIFFDDEHWQVKHLVAITARWLRGWDVLIRPAAVRNILDAPESVEVSLTRAQVEDSPSIDKDPPVSWQLHRYYHRYLNWPYEWERPGTSRTWISPALLNSLRTTPEYPVAAEPVGDPRLQSTNEVTGYRLSAGDGRSGQVKDFIFDDISWQIRYVVVATRQWWPRKNVLVPCEWITAVSWERSTVEVNLSRGVIRAAPEYHLSAPISSDYDSRVQAYYHRQFGREQRLAA